MGSDGLNSENASPLAEKMGRVRSRLSGLSTPKMVAMSTGISLLFVILASEPTGLDLKVYREGAWALLRREDLYADTLGPVGDPGLPFTYPPIGAVCFVPLAILPFWLAYALISASTYLVIVLVLTDLIEKLRWESAWMRLAAPVLVVISSPYLDTITYGQVNVVLMGVCYLTLSRFGLGWRFGFAVGLAGAIKLTPLALLLLPLVIWRWRALIGGVVTFVGLQLLGGLVFSSYTRHFWGTAVWGAERVGDLGFIDNLSLRGVVERFEMAKGWWIFGVLASVLLCGVLVYRQRKLDSSWLLGLAATAMLLISPVSWVHHFVWWPIIVLGWAGCYGRLRRWSRMSGVVLALSLMVSPKYLLRYGGLPAESRLGSFIAAVPAAVLLLGTLCAILVTCGARGSAGTMGAGPPGRGIDGAELAMPPRGAPSVAG